MEPRNTSGYRGHPDQRWGHISFAQHGDDFMLINLFEMIGVKKPSYLDVGAHHPETISNTKLLYQRGSRGVNIDANAELVELFKKERPEDINHCVGIGVKETEEAPYYKFSRTSGRNTMNADEAEEFSNAMRIMQIDLVPVTTINKVVDELCNGVWPDLLSIDIEGDDFAVIQSADFTRSRPKVICVETRRENTSAMRALLLERDYVCYCRMGENLFFVHEEFYDKVY